MKKQNTTTTKGELLENNYANMPKWHGLLYPTWSAWAKACFDAGKKESEDRVKYLEDLIRVHTGKMLENLNTLYNK